MQPLVSIVMPVYNVAEYLERAVRSKALSRALETDIPEEMFGTLRAQMEQEEA